MATTEDAIPKGDKPRGRVILKMSVQLPDGQKGTIHVFPGSDPKELAEQFCDKHHLDDPKVRAANISKPAHAATPRARRTL